LLQAARNSAGEFFLHLSSDTDVMPRAQEYIDENGIKVLRLTTPGKTEGAAPARRAVIEEPPPIIEP
jgi:hypothetical protein